jgi:hypothetical protein
MARLLGALLTIAALSLMATAVLADDTKTPMTAEMEAKMAKAKEAGMPGAGHAVLKPIEGNWTVKSKFWMKPGAKPALSDATSNFTWVLGGRFLRQTFKGTWGGQPFEGQGFLGYDNVAKEYVSVWMDSMSTGVVKSSGQYDKATKTISEKGTYNCPIAGVGKPFRAEWKLVGKNSHIYTMYTKDPAGKEFKSMELRYTRK